MSKLILVGRIAGAFGVRGEIRISTYTEEPMALVRFKRLLREDGSPALTITSGRPAKDGVVVRCPDINDKDAADALRDEVVRRWGQKGLVALALALTTARMYPTVKYALGYGKTCSRVTVAGTPAPFHSPVPQAAVSAVGSAA